MSAYTNRGDRRYRGSQQRGGSGSYRDASRYNNNNHHRDEPSWPTGKLIRAINISDLAKAETASKIEKCDYIASYNWLDHPKYPTILVPGMPPLWSPSSSMNRLKEDSGEYFRDPNAARYPRFPTEPALRALLAMHPDFDLSLLDIVGCGSTLGNLLRFCGDIDKDFRFNIDRVGNTVFFIRKEISPTVLIADICGYGHTFPEAHTTWDAEVKGSVSHQRIIQYEFGGLRLLVRSESDGYLMREVDFDSQSISISETKKSPARARKDEYEGDESTLLEALSVTSKIPSADEQLQVEMKGRPVPQKAIFDLKTRAKETRRPIDMDEIYRRLWVNQTPYFIYAEHFRGCFEPLNIEPRRVTDEITKWEVGHTELLKRYEAVLRKVIAEVRNSASGKLQVIRKGMGPLEIQERIAGDDSDVLPSDISNRW